VKLFYLSYPFSDNPDVRTNEALRLARQIMDKFPNSFVIVPHNTFNPVLPLRIQRDNNRMIRIAEAELEMISRCDALIIGVPIEEIPDRSGIIWEVAFARKIGKRILQIVFDPKYDEWLGLEEVNP